MKRALIALCLLCAISLTVAGGEVETPGLINPAPTPTPCVECQTGSTIPVQTTSGTNTLSTDVILIVLSLIRL